MWFSKETPVQREKKILTLFETGLRLKVLGSVVELLAGLTTAFINPSLVAKLAAFVTQNELTDDPNDNIANSIQEAAHTFSISNHLLIGLYLVMRGVVKLTLIHGIFKGKRVAYLFFMASLVLFGGYETYRGLVRSETLLLVLAVFDFAMLLITAHEYQRSTPPVLEDTKKRTEVERS